VNTYIQFATVMLPTAYVVVAILCGMAFAGERAPAFADRWRRKLLWLALLGHASLFAAHGIKAGTFPIVDIWLSLSGTAWVVALLFALLTVKVHRPAVGAIVLGMTAALQMLASAFGPMRAGPLTQADPGKVLHVTTIVIATASLVLSGLFGYLHLLLLRQLRHKRFGPIYQQLPDLEQLAALTRRAALAGFLCMTLGLNVGIALAHQRVAHFDYLDPAVLLTMAVWVHFGWIAFSKHIRGATARRASLAAVVGLVTILVTILLTMIPAATFHRLG